MFRFLNEINDEIAREERLLKVAIERSKDSDDYRGSMILRGPKGKKVLVKQRRYVDDAGRRRSEEVVIGAVESGEAATYIGCSALGQKNTRRKSKITKPRSTPSPRSNLTWIPRRRILTRTNSQRRYRVSPRTRRLPKLM